MYEYSSLIIVSLLSHCGPESLSRNSDSLLAGNSGDRNPILVSYSIHVRTDAGTQPDCCTMCTVLCQGVRQPGAWL
jgi:hypothetical protein